MHRYHADSGLVYSETIVQPDHRQTDWIHRRRIFSSFCSIPYRPQQLGARTLYDLAKQSTLKSLQWIHADVLKEVPEHILEDIWEQLQQGGDDTVNLWQIFRTASPESSKIPLSYCAQAMFPQIHSLSLILQPAWDVQFKCVHCLHLSNVECSVPDLVQLSQLENLAALYIGFIHNFEKKSMLFSEAGLPGNPLSLAKGVSVFPPRLLRAWGEAAESHGGFAQLRSLQLDLVGQWNGDAARNLAKLPALDWLGLGYQPRRSIRQKGWVPSEPDNTDGPDQNLLPYPSGHSYANQTAGAIYMSQYHRHQTPRTPVLLVHIGAGTVRNPPLTLYRDRTQKTQPTTSPTKPAAKRVKSMHQVGDTLKDFGI